MVFRQGLDEGWAFARLALAEAFDFRSVPGIAFVFVLAPLDTVVFPPLRAPLHKWERERRTAIEKSEDRKQALSKIGAERERRKLRFPVSRPPSSVA
jgi:hypothetical protein